MQTADFKRASHAVWDAMAPGWAERHTYWDFLARVAGAIAMVLDRLDEEERRRVRERSAMRLAPFDAAGGIELPALALVVSAS